MKRPTYLTTDPLRPFAERNTFTAHCRLCDWERERLYLEDAWPAALGHEKDHEARSS